MAEIITIGANAVVAQLMGTPSDKAKNLVADRLSYLVEGVEHMAAFTRGSWNGRNSFFTQKTATFPAGFVHLIHGELVAAGFQVRVVKKKAPEPLGPENPKVDDFPEDPRYDFQPRALRQVEKHNRGIIQVATGGGKSKIAKLITARYRRPTLFLTTRGVLMYQMKKAYENDCNFNVGVIGDGVFTPVHGVNVGMVQTLVSQLKEPDLNAEIRALIKRNMTAQEKAVKDGTPTPPTKMRKELIAEATVIVDELTRIRNRIIKILAMIEVVIGEEAHEAGGNSYYEILRWCKNAHTRIALTATPFMRTDNEDNMRLMAAFGPILIKVSEKTLIDRGILAKPYFLYRAPAPHPKLRRSSPYQRATELGIVDSPFRNADIVYHATKAAAHGLPVLILVARKKHGPILKRLLESKGLNVKQIQGENDQNEREHALAQLANGEIDVLIGTNILDVGVDVPGIGLTILAAGGKGEVQLRQRIGRGLRGKKTGPNVTFILDYTDEMNSHLRSHAKTRRAIVEATPGFAEGILKPGQDFPWMLFSDRVAA